MALYSIPFSRATLIFILSWLSTKAVAPYIEDSPPQPAPQPPQQPSQPQIPGRMCFFESSNKWCEAGKSATLCCTGLQHGQCCGNHEAGWCGSMWGEGNGSIGIITLYATNQGTNAFSSGQPQTPFAGCCSMPGTCAGDGKLERCSIRYQHYARGDVEPYEISNSESSGDESEGGVAIERRDVCAEPDLANYHNPGRGNRYIVIPQGQVNEVSNLIKGARWEELREFDEIDDENLPGLQEGEQQETWLEHDVEAEQHSVSEGHSLSALDTEFSDSSDSGRN